MNWKAVLSLFIACAFIVLIRELSSTTLNDAVNIVDLKT